MKGRFTGLGGRQGERGGLLVRKLCRLNRLVTGIGGALCRDFVALLVYHQYHSDRPTPKIRRAKKIRWSVNLGGPQHLISFCYSREPAPSVASKTIPGILNLSIWFPGTPAMGFVPGVLHEPLCEPLFPVWLRSAYPHTSVVCQDPLRNPIGILLLPRSTSPSQRLLLNNLLHTTFITGCTYWSLIWLILKTCLGVVIPLFSKT